MKTDDTPVTDSPMRSGLRGKMDKLAQDYLQRASALQAAMIILDEDERRVAAAAAPQKFLKAIAHRNGDERSHGEKRAEQIGQYLADHPGASTRDIAQALDISGATVLNHIYKVAKPVAKRKRGSRKPWNWIAKSDTGAPTKRTLAGQSARRSQAQLGRQSADDRRATVTRYLMAHPGANTTAIAQGLGWRKNQVLKFAPQVARAEGSGTGKGGPRQWYLHDPRAKKTKTKTTKAKRRHVVKPTAEWLADIKAYLSTHPEAFTVEIAKAVRRHPNSGFVKLVRQVARPARETTATQPIPWVLT